MGQHKGETNGDSTSGNFTSSTSEFHIIASKCANFSAAAIAAAAVHTAAIASTTCSTTSTTITNLGANASTTGQTASARSSSENMGQYIVKRGWWSRENLLSPGDALFQSGIPGVGWWKLGRKASTSHGRKRPFTVWSKTYDAQHARATMDGTQWSRVWSWQRKIRCVQWRTRPRLCSRTTVQKAS